MPPLKEVSVQNQSFKARKFKMFSIKRTSSLDQNWNQTDKHPHTGLLHNFSKYKCANLNTKTTFSLTSARCRENGFMISPKVQNFLAPVPTETAMFVNHLKQFLSLGALL